MNEKIAMRVARRHEAERIRSLKNKKKKEETDQRKEIAMNKKIAMRVARRQEAEQIRSLHHKKKKEEND